MITAYASLETVKNALTHGAFEYLIKPFSRHDLEETARRALARRQTELGTRTQLAMLVDEMRSLTAKTQRARRGRAPGTGGAVAPGHPALDPARDLAGHPRPARPRPAHHDGHDAAPRGARLRRGGGAPGRRDARGRLRQHVDRLPHQRRCRHAGLPGRRQPGRRAAHRPARARAARDAVRVPRRRHPQLPPVRRGGGDQAVPRAADQLRGRRHHLPRRQTAGSRAGTPPQTASSAR